MKYAETNNEMISAETNNERKSNSCERFPQESPPLRSKDVGLLIVCISSIAVATFTVLPQENVGGRPVPTLFRDRPTLYRIFLIAALCAFLGSLGSLLNQHKPRVEKFCRVIGVAFMLSALVIVLYATALWGLIIGFSLKLFLLRALYERMAVLLNHCSSTLFVCIHSCSCS